MLNPFNYICVVLVTNIRKNRHFLKGKTTDSPFIIGNNIAVLYLLVLFANWWIKRIIKKHA